MGVLPPPTLFYPLDLGFGSYPFVFPLPQSLYLQGIHLHLALQSSASQYFVSLPEKDTEYSRKDLDKLQDRTSLSFCRVKLRGGAGQGAFPTERILELEEISEIVYLILGR